MIKTIFTKAFLLMILIIAGGLSAQVKIGDDPSNIQNIKPSALLELESTNKALLVTRVITVTDVTIPVNGMIVYDNSQKCLRGYQAGAWLACGFITANSPDAIRNALSTAGCASCGDYDLAADNGWVKITAAEYTALSNASNVPGATVIGANATTFAATGSNTGTFGSSYTYNNTTIPIPSSSYIYAYAFKASSYSTNGANCTGGKVKYGTALTTGYVQYGSVLPVYNCVPLTTHYWVCKKPTVLTPASTCYLGAVNSNTGNGDPVYNGTSGYFGVGDVANIPNAGLGVQMQALTSTSKQW